MPRDLATLLVEEGAVASRGMQRAIARQREVGGALDTAILELALLDEPALVAALSRAAGLPPMPPPVLADPDPRIRRALPGRLAERHRIAPFRLDGGDLVALASWPVDLGALDELGFMLALRLDPRVAPEWRVRELNYRIYGAALPERFARLAADLREREAQRLVAGAEVPPPLPAEPSPELAAGPPEAEPAAPAPAPALRPVPQPEPAPRVAEIPAAEAAVPLVEVEAPAVVELDLGEVPPPGWSPDEARAALASARRRDEAIRVALRYARDFFAYAAFFAVLREGIAGLDGLGAPGARDDVRRIGLAIEDAGILGKVVETGGPHLGRPASPADPLLAALGRGTPRTVLLAPVHLRGRVVGVLYGDGGDAPISPQHVRDLLVFASSIGPALERILRSRKATRAAPDA